MENLNRKKSEILNVKRMWQPPAIKADALFHSPGASHETAPEDGRLGESEIQRNPIVYARLIVKRNWKYRRADNRALQNTKSSHENFHYGFRQSNRVKLENDQSDNSSWSLFGSMNCSN